MWTSCQQRVHIFMLSRGPCVNELRTRLRARILKCYRVSMPLERHINNIIAFRKPLETIDELAFDFAHVESMTPGRSEERAIEAIIQEGLLRRLRSVTEALAKAAQTGVRMHPKDEKSLSSLENHVAKFSAIVSTMREDLAERSSLLSRSVRRLQSAIIATPTPHDLDAAQSAIRSLQDAIMKYRRTFFKDAA